MAIMVLAAAAVHDPEREIPEVDHLMEQYRKHWRGPSAQDRAVDANVVDLPRPVAPPWTAEPSRPASVRADVQGDGDLGRQGIDGEEALPEEAIGPLQFLENG